MGKYHRSGLTALAIIVSATLLIITTNITFSQTRPELQPLKVGVFVSAPFVEKEGAAYTGMAIDLWKYIANRLNVKTQYVEYPNYSELLNAVSNSEIDAAVTNVTITEGRAKIVDFTHPWYDVGLRIMINDQAGRGLGSIIARLEAAGHLATYTWIAGILLALTLVLTIVDRRFDQDFPKRWRDGIAESFYHVVSFATSGKSDHKNLLGWIGRIWQALWMVCGIALLAYVTSSVTSVMTIAHLQNNINELSDLKGRAIGVRTGSVAAQVVKSQDMVAVGFDHLPDAVAALQKKEISAIVGDGPNLEYYLHVHPDSSLSLVGNRFNPDKYGFAFPQRSPWVKPASVAIIRAEETGEIQKLKETYFGKSE